MIHDYNKIKVEMCVNPCNHSCETEEGIFKMHREYTLEADDKKRLILNLAKNLKLLRTMRGLSQEELADHVGVTRQTILAVENGKREMTWTMYLAFLFLFTGHEKTREHLLLTGAYSPEVLAFLGIREEIK